MTQEEEIEKQTTIQEEQPEQTLAEKIRAEKKVRQKKLVKRSIIACIVFIFGYGIWILFKPFKASAEYGMCRTYIELSIPYPHTLYVNKITEIGGGLKIWYTHTDAFGEFRMEPMQCTIGRNPETGAMELQKLTIFKSSLSKERIAFLNSSVPYFQANPLIVDWPSALPDSLRALHFNFDRFRRIRLRIRKSV